MLEIKGFGEAGITRSTHSTSNIREPQETRLATSGAPLPAKVGRLFFCSAHPGHASTLPGGEANTVKSTGSVRERTQRRGRDPGKYDWLAPDRPISLTWRTLLAAGIGAVIVLGYVALVAWLVRG